MRFLSSEEYERIRRLHIAKQQQFKQLLLRQQGEEAGQPAATRPAASAGAGWCFAPAGAVGADDLSHSSFEVFRNLIDAFNAEDWQIVFFSDEKILQYLMLLDKGRLRRAAALLFHSDPGSIFPGFGVTFIQSRKDIALLENTTLTGSIISIAWYLMSVDYRRYRDREYKYGEDIGTWARRACLNALVNNNYAAGRSVEVFFGDDEISVRSSCILPEGWTPESLLRSWMVAPFNPEIAHAFCAGGFFFSESDLLEEQKFGVPKCTVQGDVLTVSLKIFKDCLPDGRQEDCDDYEENKEEEGSKHD